MDHVDRDLVLGAVLRRAEQFRGAPVIRVDVAGAGGGARHGMGPDDLADTGHEQLGTGADHPVDRETHRHGIEVAQTREQGRCIDRLVGLDAQLTGEHHLGQLTRSDTCSRSGDHVAPLAGGPHAAHRDLGGEARRSMRVGPGPLPGVRCPAPPTGRRTLIGRTDVGPPPCALGGATVHDRRHDHRRWRRAVEGQCAEGDRTGAGGPHLVVVTDLRQSLADPVHVIGPRGGQVDAQRDSCTPERPSGRAERRDLLAGRGVAGVQVRNSRDRAQGRGNGVAHTSPPRVAVISCAMPTVSRVRFTWVNPQRSSDASISDGSGR